MKKSGLEILKQTATEDLRYVRKIIACIKNVSYEDLVFSPENVLLDDAELRYFTQLFQRYKNKEPVSKIIGKKEFWKHEFFVNKNVLDPRPETEILLEAVLARFNKNDSLNFLDLGTGSGCILLSLLEEYPNSHGIGIDISKEAIEVAKKNKDKLHINNRADFLNISWNELCLFSKKIPEIDVIVSNPPYIKTSDIQTLDTNVKYYDPTVALDGGSDGLDKYREIAKISKRILSKSSSDKKSIFLEVGYDQAQSVKKILFKNDFSNIESVKDLNGIDRIIVAQSNIN